MTVHVHVKNTVRTLCTYSVQQSTLTIENIIKQYKIFKEENSLPI